MITEGLILAIIGMSVVFTFLLVLIGIMNLLATLMKPLARLIPEPEEKKEVAIKKAVVESHEDIAIALAAVRSFVK